MMRSLLDRVCHWLWIVLITARVLLPGSLAIAAPERQDFDCSRLPDVDWRETLTDTVAYLYPAEYEDLLKSLLLMFGDKLEAEYAAFARLFETNLPLPITVRIYPSLAYFTCLNVIVPPISGDQFHSHVGNREITLLGDRIRANATTWDREALNAFRFELGILFIENITEGKSPPGLLGGAGYYMMDPNDIFEAHEISGAGSLTPDVTWRSLWESEDSLTFEDGRIQSASVIAYLVDVYGWQKFLDFLNDLRTSEGFRQSLSQEYGADFSKLQSQWEKYYPLYYQGRWRAHVLYFFDLTPYETMIDGGAYTDAFLGLKDVIAFLEKNEQTSKLREAQALQEKAKTGQNASSLILQSRQALQGGNYALSIQLADQAQVILDGLGDARRTAELDSYRAWAAEVNSLQVEMDQLMQAYQAGGDLKANLDRMLVVSQRLAGLGESQARTRVAEVLQGQEASLQAERHQFFVGILLCASAFLIIRILLLRFKTPREKL